MNAKSTKKKKLKNINYSVNPQNFINRELSWLEFNSRVLNEARDERTPLLERLRFLSIFSSNLDEFVMKRIGGLKQQISSIYNFKSIDGLTPQEQLKKIREKISIDNKEQEAIFLKIKDELKSKKIFLNDYKDLSKKDQEFADQYFKEKIFPILTPLSVDPGKPFPFISNLSYSLGVQLRHPIHQTKIFSRIKILDVIPRWLPLPVEPGQFQFVKMVDVIIQNIGALYPGMEILKVVPFKVTRNADIDYDDEEAADLLEMIEESLKERRTQECLKLDYIKGADEKMLRMLKDSLELSDEDLYEHEHTIDFLNFGPILDLDIAELKYKPWAPIIPSEFMSENLNLFQLLKQKDILIHNPYESFSSTIERFISEAADDPNVLAIKMTLYRSGDDSNFIRSLIRAVENGKQVVCLVELKARFDEKRNIHLAHRLEKAGVHVVYGVLGLKTHTKITLVVRKENNGNIMRYAHIGTGNYNSRTANLYTDLNILTANKNICEELGEVFNYLTGSSLKLDYNTLLVAPINMKSTFLRKIKEQTRIAKKGIKTRIIAKMNSLEEAVITEALYEASQAGVEIILIVRGFCCLKPGVKGLSENIKVISVIGRFLEHSRIFYFSNGESDPTRGEFFIGSADWMHRNLHARVEIIIPVLSKTIAFKLYEFLEVLISDNRSAWEMKADGTYTQRNDKKSLGTHEVMMKVTNTKESSIIR
jgi:polyphosphate kinase